MKGMARLSAGSVRDSLWESLSDPKADLKKRRSGRLWSPERCPYRSANGSCAQRRRDLRCFPS